MQQSPKPLKILWMIPKWTLPATDGARVATDSLVRSSIAAGGEIDILCLPLSSEKTDSSLMKKAWGVKNVFVIPREVPNEGFARIAYFLKSFLTKPFMPLTFSSFNTSKIQKLVHKYISEGDYDFVLLDGLHLGAALLLRGKFNIPVNGPKVIYRAHNIEVDLWIKAYREKKSLWIKAILFIQSLIVGNFERIIIKQSQGVAAIAQEDLIEINNMSPTSLQLVPLGLDFGTPLDFCKDIKVKFLFIGRLDWPPNKDGLEWVLKEVWPSVIANRPEATLKIVGSGNGAWLDSYKDIKGLQIVGFVDSIMDAYRDCHFTIVPITYGSGTRIKVIESFAVGRRLISTKMGVQGADLELTDYINAETKEDWIQTLSSISFDQAEQEQLIRSRSAVALKFSEKTIGARFYQWLKTFS